MVANSGLTGTADASAYAAVMADINLYADPEYNAQSTPTTAFCFTNEAPKDGCVGTWATKAKDGNNKRIYANFGKCCAVIATNATTEDNRKTDCEAQIGCAYHAPADESEDGTCTPVATPPRGGGSSGAAGTTG